MALDGITSEIITYELNRDLKGARIDKIFQPDKYTVILHIRTSSGVKKLLISINPSAPRINITESTRENPMMPPSFCMLLRKYLSGARIESITNPGYERIIEINVTNTDELHDTNSLRLVAELMGRYSNLILINRSGKILDSAVHVDYSVSRVREVMPARIYEYPPSQDKMTIEEAALKIESGKLPILETEMGRPVEKAILNSIKGMSPTLSRQICTKADIEDRLPVSGLSDMDLESLKKEINDIAVQIRDHSYTPCAYFTGEGYAADWSPFRFTGFDRTVRADDVSRAIDLYYEQKDRFIDLDNKKRRLLSIIDSALNHLTKRAEIHRQDCEEGKKADIFKHDADLILSNSYKVTGKADSITCTDYYSDPPAEVTIRLDPTLNASDNAQEYYKKFHKAKRKAELSEAYLNDDLIAIEYFRSIKTAAVSAKCEDDIRAIAQEINSLSKPRSEKKTENINPNTTVGKSKSGNKSSRAMREAAKRANEKKNTKKRQEKPLPLRRYTTSDGYEILCGRNNIQNDDLTFHTADKDDWWFHIKGMPGTHVILRSKKGEDIPSDNAVIEAAQTAAFFSKGMILEEHNAIEGSKPGQIKAEIDYCKVSHVKKLPGGKPGMVTYEGYYSIVVTAKEPEINNDL